MEPDREIDGIDAIADLNAADEPMSVDDFIRELEAKEKDLHITAETTIIEIAQGFDDANAPAFLKEAVAVPAPPAPPVAAAPAPAADPAAEIEALETEITILRGRVEELEADYDEAVKSAQRRTRDFENFRARTERERSNDENARAAGLASRLLPAVDNLDRALAFAGTLDDRHSGEFAPFFDGIELVRRQIGEIFDEMGIREIDALGSEFDPHLHEAVAAEPTIEVPSNTVFEELLKGYTLGDIVIRHSMVKVAVEPDGDPPAADTDAIHETEPAAAPLED